MNQDGPSLIIELSGFYIAKDVNMFSHICKTYYPLFFLVVHMYPV